MLIGRILNVFICPRAAFVYSFAVMVLAPLRAGAFTTLDPSLSFTLTNQPYDVGNRFRTYFVAGAPPATDSANEWSSVTTSTFRYYFSAGNANFIEAADLSGDPSVPSDVVAFCAIKCLAVTKNVFAANGRLSGFQTWINIGVDHSEDVGGTGQHDYAWYDGTQAPTIPPNYFDLRTAIRHELGHALGLCHTPDDNPLAASGFVYSPFLMFERLGKGQQKYIVGDANNDAPNGSSWLYPSGYTGPGPQRPCWQGVSS